MDPTNPDLWTATARRASGLPRRRPRTLRRRHAGPTQHPPSTPTSSSYVRAFPPFKKKNLKIKKFVILIYDPAPSAATLSLAFPSHRGCAQVVGNSAPAAVGFLVGQCGVALGDAFLAVTVAAYLIAGLLFAAAAASIDPHPKAPP